MVNKLTVLVAAVGAAALLQGCGAESCSTDAAEVQAAPGSCSLPPDAEVAVEFQLCPECSHTSPSCVAEFVDATTIEFDTAFQQCEENLGCPTTGSCGITNDRVVCRFRTPPASGLPLRYVAGRTLVQGTITLANNALPSCAL